MRSERWTAEVSNTRVAVRAQPWIDPGGHISGSALLTWRCSAYQWFATTVRSVIQRISKREVVQKRSKYKTSRQLTLIAILYASTNDDRMLERLLNCKAKGFSKLLYHYINSVGAKTRFLYDQAVKAALWFELRGNPRVQPTKTTVLPEYRKFLRTYSTQRHKMDVVQALSDPWVIECKSYTRGMCMLTYK